MTLKKRKTSQSQNVTQIVKIMLSDLKPKKKRKRRKSKIPPKPRSALDIARNPQPYQFNMYTPPFPAVINHQPKANANSQNVSNTFRNIRAVNAKELERLRGDLTAYRQESQTIFKKLVAFPREKVYYEPMPVVTEPEDETKEVVGDLLSEMISAVEDKEATDAEAINRLNEMVSNTGFAIEKESIEAGDDEEIRQSEESIAPVRKKRAPNINKTRNQLRAELETFSDGKMSNTQFSKTRLPEMRALAKAKGIELTL